MKTVCLLTCTKDRHKNLERIVKFVTDQTYQGKIYHVIFNNSTTPLKLNSRLSPDKFILVNNYINTKTGDKYSTLGQIYNDAIKYIPEDSDLVNFMDDDDIYLPNHVEEGVKGIEKGGKKAYKPMKSWFKTRTGLALAENTLEPSIFVEASHIKEHGFSDETVAHHHNWIRPLIEKHEIFVDPDGKPTYICDWSQQIPTFKTSGDPYNPKNFENYHNWSKDIGDSIITPISSAKNYYI